LACSGSDLVETIYGPSADCSGAAISTTTYDQDICYNGTKAYCGEIPALNNSAEIVFYGQGANTCSGSDLVYDGWMAPVQTCFFGALLNSIVDDLTLNYTQLSCATDSNTMIVTSCANSDCSVGCKETLLPTGCSSSSLVVVESFMLAECGSSISISYTPNLFITLVMLVTALKN